jgi:hypothetical protein
LPSLGPGQVSQQRAHCSAVKPEQQGAQPPSSLPGPLHLNLVYLEREAAHQLEQAILGGGTYPSQVILM